MRFTAAAFGLTALVLGACEREQEAVEQDLPAARATRARADVQQIAAAVRIYQANVRGTAGLARRTDADAHERRHQRGSLSRVDPGAARRVVAVPVRAAGHRPIHRRASGDGVGVSAPE